MRIYLLHAKGCHVNKNSGGTLCELTNISFVFGCRLSASVGNLLKFLSRSFKN